MNIFFDTSVLVKLFHRENGSVEVEHLFNDNTIIISELAVAEFYSATLRKFREKAVTEQQVKEILSAFDDQLAFFVVEPLRRAVIEASKSIIRKGGKKFPIRTLDALQLATYSLIADSSWIFACADTQALNVAQELGFKTIHPGK